MRGGSFWSLMRIDDKRKKKKKAKPDKAINVISNGILYIYVMEI